MIYRVTFCYRQRNQIATAIERTYSDRDHAFRDSDGCQPTAVLERTLSNSGHIRRDLAGLASNHQRIGRAINNTVLITMIYGVTLCYRQRGQIAAACKSTTINIGHAFGDSNNRQAAAATKCMLFNRSQLPTIPKCSNGHTLGKSNGCQSTTTPKCSIFDTDHAHRKSNGCQSTTACE